MYRRNFLKASMVTPFIFSGLNLSALEVVNKEPRVINAGVGGNTTADMLARIDKNCLAHRPDLTVFMAGTNDMNSKKYIPLPQYEKNMRSIIGKILDVGSHIILMPILPAYEPYLYTRHDKSFYEPEGYVGRKNEMNKLIRNLASEYQLTFLDMHHIFEMIGNIGEEENSLIQNEANSGKTDGLHPTNNGYRLMAVAIYECIIQNNLPHERVVCFGDSITVGAYPGYLRKLLSES
ncbi:SGNH/GDSL hydrolase family protein [Proteiniphilum sp.]|uniref:SGNH/GDSL hydrolase family protein n=1 Tax=Proteiniphilum sp. TaxID=1926877 RepID=UPI002B209D59|nr:SGNH/GDSL hydrolase family protein [Proteiniphilum sp.]MEA4918660.1 SGNH/GDSL hydrolase family protein [Proteiniphilum sp.]